MSSDDLDIARRLLFALTVAERDAGLEIQPSIALAERLQRILAAANAKPGVITPRHYEICFFMYSRMPAPAEA